MDLSPGTILLGKYRIDELIGTGGMGNVVRASHLYLQQAVAIKVLLPQMAESDSTKQRFLREAQATVKLKSEHSARVMDVGTSPEGVPFMVMEFLEGNDLNQILRHHGPQAPSIVVDLMLQACEGIAEAHALGIIHRDIKPSNFFITRRPDGSMLLKILDFGISKTPIGYDELTGTQTVIGTPSYMAPEQMKSGRSADPRSDIWSIGVVMYQLINGRPPFSGESYAELVLKVGLEPPSPMLVPLPAGLGEVILKCLEKDPNLRHQHVGELARMLAPYATDPQSAAQSAARAGRILQNRGAQMTFNGRPQIGMQGSPLSSAGGLATPVPISPAQLTPRSWPPSQATSLSHGAGQVTLKTRGNRGLLIAGVASLCVIAAAGGYIVSQASRKAAHSEPHVPMSSVVPPGSAVPTPESPAATTSSAATAGVAAAGAAPTTGAAPAAGAAAAGAAPTAGSAPAAGIAAAGTAPATGTTAPTTGSGATVVTPAAGASTPTAGSSATATGSNGSAGPWREQPTVPTFGKTEPAAPKPAEAPRPANNTLVDVAKPPEPVRPKPIDAVKPTKPDDTPKPRPRPAAVHSDPPKPRPTPKPKKDDGLFDSRK